LHEVQNFTVTSAKAGAERHMDAGTPAQYLAGGEAAQGVFIKIFVTIKTITEGRQHVVGIVSVPLRSLVEVAGQAKFCLRHRVGERKSRCTFSWCLVARHAILAHIVLAS